MNDLLELAAENLLRSSGGFLLFVIIISIASTTWFQYKIFKSLERSRMQIAAEISEIRALIAAEISELRGLIGRHHTELRGLIGHHDIRIIHLEHEISWVKGNMITWDVLKRIEMLLSTRASSDVDNVLANIIKAEIFSRRSSDQ